MVGLGTCGGTDLNNFINVNELTTVASVWALAPFMTGIANIGSSSTNAAGLANAFAAINELVNTANGTIPGPALPTGATLPTTEINTLGDILEQCINSGGGVEGDGSACGNLFKYAPNARHCVPHGHNHRRHEHCPGAGTEYRKSQQAALRQSGIPACVRR